MKEKKMLNKVYFLFSKGIDKNSDESISKNINKNICISLTSDRPFQIDERMVSLCKAYLPGVILSEKKQSSMKKSTFFIVHKEKSKDKISQKGNTIFITGLWNQVITLDVYHLLYCILRIQLLEKELFSVHAACIGKEKKYFLLMGHSGVGKTAITLALLQKKFLFFSGNKTVLSFSNRLEAIAGTTAITVREQDIFRYDFIGKKSIAYANRNILQMNEVNDRDYNQNDNLENNSENVISKKNFFIKGIILPHLNDGVTECTHLSEKSALHTLYPFFLDVVNADVIIGEDIFSGEVNENLKKKLVFHLRKILKKIPVYEISGSKEFILSKISKMSKINKIESGFI